MSHLVNLVVAADNAAATALVTSLKAFIGPILLAIIGIVALRFLFNHQIMQFITFVVVAILVGVLFYNPEIIKTIANSFVKGAGGDTLGT